MALSWCFTNEQSPESLAVLQLARCSLTIVPSLWHIETCNVLGMAFRKQRLREADLHVVLRLLTSLEMHTDMAVPFVGTSALLPLMQAYALTAYDAVYLELALRLNLPLATLDTDLATAAEQAGVALVRNIP
jgi:predicted nucleic acid-binding protein